MRILRSLASVRIPSHHAPDIDYELVHAVVGDERASHESVLLRLKQGETTLDASAVEIHHEDLSVVLAQLSRFIHDVLWRRAQSGDTEARAKLEAMPPSPVTMIVGRGQQQPQKAAEPAVPYIPVKKEKKKTLEIPSSFGNVKSKAVPPPPEAPRVPEHHDIIAFTLSTPPTVDNVLHTVESQPGHLIVVSPVALVPKVEEYIASVKTGLVSGPPPGLILIAINRVTIGPQGAKKLRMEIMAGITRMLGQPNAALWITPA